MKITKRNILNHELIGLHVKILKHLNNSLSNAEGKVIWETRNFLVLKSKNKVVKVQKQGSILIFKLPNGNYVKVVGDKLINRPEDRLKQV